MPYPELRMTYPDPTLVHYDLRMPYPDLTLTHSDVTLVHFDLRVPYPDLTMGQSESTVAGKCSTYETTLRTGEP